MYTTCSPRKQTLDMGRVDRTFSPIEQLPEELLLCILDYHFDLERVPISVATEWSCRLPQLQLQHKLQMSLCRVSKRFRESISRLFSQNGLLRVTCWIDPHLDFYYFSPTVCLSDRTDMLQVPCPEVVIDLAHGLPEAFAVHSIISTKMLPRVLEIAKLHHDTALTVLPRLSDLAPHGKITIDISSESPAKFPCLHDVESIISGSLPGSSKTNVDTVSEVEEAPTGKVGIIASTLRFSFGQWEPCTELPRPSWDVAFKTGRMHCLSTDGNHRRLGLQILRYLLATMLVALEPWNTEEMAYAGSAADLKMMTLTSAILIDALVVEPDLLSVLYGEASPNVIRSFHHEICPCKYLPYGICAGPRYGFPKNDETWLFVQTTTHYLHSMLVSDGSRRTIRLTNFRNRRDRMSQDMFNVRKRCDVYIDSLERHYDEPDGCRFVPENPPVKIYIPPA
jgi:hypothetical protein